MNSAVYGGGIFNFVPMETDLILLSAARTMKKEALVKIFDLYSSALYNYALRLCGDPVTADQIVGDVFVKLLEQFSSGNGPSTNLRSYLYEIAYHLIIDELRDSQRTVPLEAVASLRQDAPPGFFSWENQILFKQLLHVMRQELTDDQRHVIILRFLEEFSLQETAAILGKNVNSIKVIQNRALAKLRKALDRQGIRKPIPSPGIRSLSNALRV
jgi:RNA polymerase sigma-70 factor, ECF subfamily